MTADPYTFESDPAALAASQIARLEVLAEVGQGLISRLAREAEAIGEGRLDIATVALAYGRLAKAVRQTLALQARIAAEAAEKKRAAEARPGRDEATVKIVHDFTPTRRNRAVDALELAIEVEAGENEVKFERLEKELYEELEALDEDAFDERPIGAIVAEICEILGIEPDLSLWEAEAWAIEETRTNVPGSPYARTVGVAVADATTGVLEHHPP